MRCPALPHSVSCFACPLSCFDRTATQDIQPATASLRLAFLDDCAKSDCRASDCHGKTEAKQSVLLRRMNPGFAVSHETNRCLHHARHSSVALPT